MGLGNAENRDQGTTEVKGRELGSRSLNSSVQKLLERACLKERERETY